MQMKISTFLKPLSFLPALALMYMIYTFSAQSGDVSSMTSYRVSEKVVKTANTVTQQHWDDWQVQTYSQQLNGIVRKGAHVTEYFLLAVAVSFPLYVYGVRGILLMLLAGAICVGYAFGDEYHQSLVSGRVSSTRDVAIDSIGIFFGIILTRLIGWSGRMAITGPAYERKQNQREKELNEREEELKQREQALRRQEARRRDPSYGRPSAQRYSAEDTRGRQRAEDARGRQCAEDTRGRQRAEDARGRQRAEDARGRQRAEDVRGRQRAEDARGRQSTEDARRRQAAPQERMDAVPGDRTRVIGPASEVDDRTRVYKSTRQAEAEEEAYRQASYERRKVQSPELQEDSTSDQLSEDIPFSGLFNRRRDS